MNKSTILQIKNKEGDLVEEENLFHKAFIEHFQSYLQADPTVDCSNLIEDIPKSISVQ